MKGKEKKLAVIKKETELDPLKRETPSRWVQEGIECNAVFHMVGFIKSLIEHNIRKENMLALCEAIKSNPLPFVTNGFKCDAYRWESEVRRIKTAKGKEKIETILHCLPVWQFGSTFSAFDHYLRRQKAMGTDITSPNIAIIDARQHILYMPDGMKAEEILREDCKVPVYVDLGWSRVINGSVNNNKFCLLYESELLLHLVRMLPWEGKLKISYMSQAEDDSGGKTSDHNLRKKKKGMLYEQEGLFDKMKKRKSMELSYGTFLKVCGSSPLFEEGLEIERLPPKISLIGEDGFIRRIVTDSVDDEMRQFLKDHIRRLLMEGKELVKHCRAQGIVELF